MFGSGYMCFVFLGCDKLCFKFKYISNTYCVPGPVSADGSSVVNKIQPLEKYIVLLLRNPQFNKEYDWKDVVQFGQSFMFIMCIQKDQE